MICSLINEPTKIEGFLDGEDPLSTMRALNQMGAANEKLLKLAQTMQKYQLKEMDLEGKSGPGSQELKGSVFSNLTSMLHKNDNA